MLTSLRIRNLAVIEDVTVAVDEGFTVLTGETGAGKSILVDGLSLALGERADRDLVRAGAAEAVVEAVFDVAGLPAVKARLEALELSAPDGELQVRRVVTSSGRGRCAVNGSPVPLGELKRLGDLLADLHGQHDHQLLLDDATHLGFLDAFAGLDGARRGVAEAYVAWKDAIEEVARLSARDAGKAERLDELNFQIQEIASARLAPEEDERLREERSRLAHARRIIEALSQAREALSGERGAAAAFGEAVASLRGVRAFDASRLDPRIEALTRLADEAREEGAAARALAESLDADPGRLEQVEERLDLVERLKRKYGGSIEAVLATHDRARAEAGELASLESGLAERKGRVEALRADLSDQASSLSRAREEAASKFAERVGDELRELAMGGADFGVRCTEDGDPNGPVELDGSRYACGPDGIDRVEFYLAPNVGEGTRPLKAIASGGELSRLMLAVKGVLAGADRVGTLVFDEIDSGIGGKVAEIVGRKLARIAKARQVLCITHLPQIAACARAHASVTKRSARGKTRVTVTPLDRAERVQELARMLAGEEVTRTALQHAEALLAAEQRR